MIARPIEKAPLNTKVILYNKLYEVFPVAYLAPIDGGTYPHMMWHIVDEAFPTTHDDGLLWPDEDLMPTHFIDLPEDWEGI